MHAVDDETECFIPSCGFSIASAEYEGSASGEEGPRNKCSRTEYEAKTDYFSSRYAAPNAAR